jgi:hypothetical protein
MSEMDDGAFRRRVIELLEEHRFGWIVEQAEAQIAEGKSVVKEVSEQELRPAVLSDTFRIARPRRYRSSLVTTVAFSESEKLELLLKAIEAAVVKRADLDTAVLEKLPTIGSIAFEPDAPDEGADGGYRGRPHRLVRDTAPDRASLREDADKVLRAVREEIL